MLQKIKRDAEAFLGEPVERAVVTVPAYCDDNRRDWRFERAGADLLRPETISLVDAVLGTALDVPTLTGSISGSVPAGTQPGEVLRLKEKRPPVFGSARMREL